MTRISHSKHLLLTLYLCLLKIVKLESAQLDMNVGADDKFVGELHSVILIMYREQDPRDEIFWQNDACLKLAIDSPYTQSNDWYPFTEENKPVCTVSSGDKQARNLNFCSFASFFTRFLFLFCYN